MMLLAAGMAAICGVVGLYLSYYLGIASGAAIVLTCTALFLLAWAGSRLRSALSAGGRAREEEKAEI
jgi:manganese/iron transport system permease protein